MILQTRRQLASIVRASESDFSGASFQARRVEAGWALVVVDGDRAYTCASARSQDEPRRFATIEAALSEAQSIADLAGRERDHGWTGSPERRRAMPQFTVYIPEPR